MDARAFDDVDEATVIDVGTRAECLALARSGDYGECVVVGPDGSVAWECYSMHGWRSEEEQRRLEGERG